MHDIEIVLTVLLASVALFAAVSGTIGVPYPIVLVLGGLVLGVAHIPGMPTIALAPDLVLVIFLPPLLYSAAFFASLRDLRRDMRVISLLAVGLVIATTCAVAVAAHALIDGLPWAAAFTLGAIVAPTDPIAATAVLQRVGAPRRMVNILEGEALINDGTALVLYHAAILAVGGTFSLLEAGKDFVLDAGGGILVGLVAGKLIAEFRRRIDDPPVEVTISLLSGYAAYVPAERIGASGVLATVTAGIYVGWLAPEISTARMRLQGAAMWEILTFLLNALLFVLIGLQLPRVVDALGGQPSTELAVAAAVVCVVVIATRMVWGQIITWLIRILDRRPSQLARRSTWRERIVSGWAGMRGAVSLAAALALTPGFPGRDEILFVTFAVIFVTLVVQGLTLPAVIHWAGIRDDGGEEREDLLARRAATAAALGRLDELAAEEWTRDDTIERMRALYHYRERRLTARAGESDEDGLERRSLSYQKIVRSVIDAQRDAVVDLRNTGEISNEVMHRIERELDLEDERLEI